MRPGSRGSTPVPSAAGAAPLLDNMFVCLSGVERKVGALQPVAACLTPSLVAICGAVLPPPAPLPTTQRTMELVQQLGGSCSDVLSPRTTVLLASTMFSSKAQVGRAFFG